MPGVRDLNYLAPGAMEAMLAPGFVERLYQGVKNGHIPEELARDLIKDINQFRRAEDGDRFRPGEYNDDPRLPTHAMPFAPREEHRPDRLPGSPKHAVLKAASENIEAEFLTRDLQSRLGTDKIDAAAPPTLRESVEAAMSAHAGDEP